MKRNKWPYWVKGGIAGLILGLATILADLLGWTFPLLFLFTPNAVLIGVLSPAILLEDNIHLAIYSSPATYAIAGLIIGWLYDKIKSRKSQAFSPKP